MAWPASWGSTPLGCRVVMLTCVLCYLIYRFDYSDFIQLNMVCKASDALVFWNIFRWEGNVYDTVMVWRWQRLITVSFVHTSLAELCFVLLVFWRRLVWIENRMGTLGFVVWFVWSSCVVHAIVCASICVVACFLDIVRPAEVDLHGLYPLLVTHLATQSGGNCANESIWLWPLPLHVPVRVFPFVVVLCSWLMHCYAHLDVAAAYVLAVNSPLWLLEPSTAALDTFERSWLGVTLLAALQRSDAFVCRQPCGSSGDLFEQRKKESELFAAGSTQGGSGTAFLGRSDSKGFDSLL
eukprot:TRINITY_DN58588_c0_g1_i1.p1 TRINITY_DN58588_c0_g1~~TRINITY_DN58588_c0_g1_i1.p1  ORF type:complete len:295 (-),score=29.74 TRINITY_DN58588_c0_g1_i1:36-920(-)